MTVEGKRIANSGTANRSKQDPALSV